MDIDIKCSKCRKSSMLECTICFAPYCSVICQKYDWQKHKDLCIPMPPLQQRDDSVNNGPIKSNVYPKINLHRRNDDQEKIENDLKALRITTSVAEKENIKPDLKSTLSNIIPRPLKTVEKTEEVIQKSPVIEKIVVPNVIEKIVAVDLEPQRPVQPEPPKVQPPVVVVAIQDDVNKEPQNWKTPFPLDEYENKFFRVTVTEKMSIQNNYWVTDVKHYNVCLNFLVEVNDFKEYVPLRGSISLGEMYIVKFTDELKYRCEAIESVNHLGEVKVRLIDYGSEFYTKESELMIAPAKLKSVNSFAFRIQISESKFYHFENEEEISIQILRLNDQNAYVVKLSNDNTSTKPNFDDFIGRPIRISAIHAPNQATCCLADNHLGHILRKWLISECNKANPVQLNSSHFKIGEIVLASINGLIWSRCIILAIHDTLFVVLDLDTALIDICKHVKKPFDTESLFTQFQVLIVFIEVKSCAMDKSLFREQFFYDNSTLNYTRTSDGKFFITNDKMKQIAEVDLKFWDHSIEMMQRQIAFWRPKLPLDSPVFVTAVDDDAMSICITLQNKIGFYDEIMSKIGEMAEPLKIPPETGDFVMVKSLGEVKFYRGIVIADVTPGSVYIVVSIDNGSRNEVNFSSMISPNNFVRFAPIYTMNVVWENSIRCAVKTENVIGAVKLLAKNRVPFIWKMVNGQTELVFAADNNTLSAMVTKIIEEANNKMKNRPPAVPVSTTESSGSSDLIMFPEIEMVRIKEGKNIRLFCLDDTTIGKGYITAAMLDDEFMNNFVQIPEKVTEYCKNLPSVAHSPLVNEVCLAKFKDDGAWYRAYCTSIDEKVEPPVYEIIFLDYGNLVFESSENLRKFPRSLLLKCFAHTCLIKEKFSPQMAEKYREIIQCGQSHFIADEVNAFGDGYIISIASIIAKVSSE